MIVFPNCKVNLGLHVVQKRPDGYHDLQTVFFPLPFRDILEILPSSSFALHSTGLTIPGDPASNLCVKAYQLVKDRFPELPPVHIHLHKIIPMGGGLGGGSSNGSFTLLALNEIFDLKLARKDLLEMSIQLGSDCPFFIMNEPSYATGRGEQMKPVDINLKGYYIILVLPGIHVSTAQAFSGIIPKKPKTDLEHNIGMAPDSWKDWLINDFEDSVFLQFPAIEVIKSWLYQQGAVYASMTGTGSTVYGLFKEKPALAQAPNGEVHIIAL
ncbi:MAG: 4-(cytidine 5'-diphospho)-2-C-methyl-D-erythritol kinase [Sphingobacteriales bacterium]|jgi:4-diphosphocytidyl-2-C-methyl-D-erythritol kinase